MQKKMRDEYDFSKGKPNPYIKEERFIVSQSMTLEEKLALSGKAAELWKTGDKEGFIRLMKTVPMPPYLAKVMKDKMGLDYLINSGWNLSEAEAEFGIDWISR